MLMDSFLSSEELVIEGKLTTLTTFTISRFHCRVQEEEEGNIGSAKKCVWRGGWGEGGGYLFMLVGGRG